MAFLATDEPSLTSDSMFTWIQVPTSITYLVLHIYYLGKKKH